MTEKKLVEVFFEMCRWMVPYNKPAFEAYINGEAGWIEGTRFEKGTYRDEIEEEFDGPNDALALRMRIALARSWNIADVAAYKGGVRALQAIGVPLETVYAACTDRWYWSGYEMGRYYEEAAPFVDKLFRKSRSKYPSHIIIAMVIALLEKDPQEHARFIPVLEGFIEKSFSEEVKALKWNSPFRASRFAFRKGLGRLSPELQKLELRTMIDLDRAEYETTRKEVLEAAMRLNLPPEWFEVERLIQPDDNKDSSQADHFKKLFKEDRPLFDKVHRVFYSTWDNIKADDLSHPRIRKSHFLDSLKLLAIKLANGAGKKELEDIKKNWKNYMPLDTLRKDGIYWDSDVLPLSLLYEHGIEPLNKLFTAYFKRESLRTFFLARQYWVAPKAAIKTLVALKHGTLEGIFLEQMEPPLFGADPIPPRVTCEAIAAFPQESRAFFANALKEADPDGLLRFVEAAFAKGGFVITEALVLLNSSSQKVLDAAQDMFFEHEAELRPTIEARLPRFKKTSALAAQQLLARWDAQ